MITIGQIPRPRTASERCPDVNVVNVRKKDILLITAHDKKYFGGDEHIHIEVRDVDALIEMLILGQREAVRRGSESGAG